MMKEYKFNFFFLSKILVVINIYHYSLISLYIKSDIQRNAHAH